MKKFTRELVNAVNISRLQRVELVDWKVLWFAVNLAGPGKDELDGAIINPTGLEQRELRAAVDVKVGLRIFHRVEVTRLAGKVKDVILSLDKIPHRMAVADIGNIDAHGVLDAADVKKVAAVL